MKDKELIEKAETMNCNNWHEINDIAKQAESVEAKDKLMNIMRRKYHEEEYTSGLL